MSFVYTMNNIDTTTDPCGSPLVTLFYFNFSSITFYFHPVKMILYSFLYFTFETSCFPFSIFTYVGPYNFFSRKCMHSAHPCLFLVISTSLDWTRNKLVTHAWSLVNKANDNKSLELVFLTCGRATSWAGIASSRNLCSLVKITFEYVEYITLPVTC